MSDSTPDPDPTATESSDSSHTTASLTDFTGTTADTTATEDTNNTTQSASPLDRTYEWLQSVVTDTPYTAALEQGHASPIEPQSAAYERLDVAAYDSPGDEDKLSDDVTTIRLAESPPDSPAIPTRIGAWSLATTGPNTILYTATADVYDARYGDGAALIGVELHYNGRGWNADNNYYIKSSKTVSYEEADAVRNHTVSDRSDMMGVRGFNPKDNAGDHGVVWGVDTYHPQLGDAIGTLLIRLHALPEPVPTPNLATAIDDGWRVQQHGYATTKLTAPAPDGLATHGTHLSLNRFDHKVVLRTMTHPDAVDADLRGPRREAIYDLSPLVDALNTKCWVANGRVRTKTQLTAETILKTLAQHSPTEVASSVQQLD